MVIITNFLIQIHADCCGSYLRWDCLQGNGERYPMKDNYCGDCASPSLGFGCCGSEGAPGGGHYGCNIFCCNCECRPWCSNCTHIRPPVPKAVTHPIKINKCVDYGLLPHILIMTETRTKHRT